MNYTCKNKCTLNTLAVTDHKAIGFHDLQIKDFSYSSIKFDVRATHIFIVSSFNF